MNYLVYFNIINMNTMEGTQKGGRMQVEVIKANNPFDEIAKVRKIDRLRVAIMVS